MLKSPRYSAARAHQSEPFDQMPYKMQSDEQAQQKPAKRLAGKENIRSDDYHESSSGQDEGIGKSIDCLSNLRQTAVQDMLANKARSSLAASSYHASGSLPQYDGAGDAATSSDSQARLKDVQAGGASAGFQREDKAAANQGGEYTSPAHSSRREQAKEYDVGPSDSYDYRGLTRKDFIVAPDRPRNRVAHHRLVEGFFDRLQEEELREMAATQASTYRRI